MAIRLLGFSLWLLTCLNAPHSLAQSTEDVVIGVGDTISISVYNEPDLTVKGRVGRSESVKMPLIGEVNVVGRTPAALSEEIEMRLFDGYLVNPIVTVKIESFRPFFIRGAVNRPGSYEYRLNLTVDQAIAVAGGLKDRASKKEWYVIRQPDEKPLKVNKETPVKPGDIIEIKESLF